MQKLIFGLGTGRCGTHSLHKLLKEQDGADISHEMGDFPFLPWEKSELRLKDYMWRITDTDSEFVGDIAFYCLPYVRDILKLHPDAKFIALERDRAETVESYMKKTEGRNHWQHHDETRSTSYRHCPWDISYPKYHFFMTKKYAIGEYYDDYYSECRLLEEEFPNNVKLFKMEELNSRTGVASILHFAGIENKNIKVGIKEKAREN